jgi:hypothetical protein
MKELPSHRRLSRSSELLISSDAIISDEGGVCFLLKAKDESAIENATSETRAIVAEGA